MANHPIVSVTWNDALEYCRWLQGELASVSQQRLVNSGNNQAEKDFWQGLASGKLHVTPPSEAEWEKAARGTDGRIYPWQDNYDSGRANTDETGIGSTSAVGCFPGGASPFGVQDMAGNVWEWTRSKYEDYPYQSDDGREDLSGNAQRVRRGGSFYNSRRLARCAFRSRSSPDLRDLSLGFRVVVSPF